MKQIPGIISLGGEGKNFNHGAHSHIAPQTHILSSYIVWYLELLRQLGPRVVLRSHLLGPFVDLVCVPSFGQLEDILYLLLLFFRADTRQKYVGSHQGGEIYTHCIFQPLPLCGLKKQKLFFFPP